MLIDWFTVIAQIINFLILVALLKHFLFNPIVSAMNERREKSTRQSMTPKRERKRPTSSCSCTDRRIGSSMKKEISSSTQLKKRRKKRGDEFLEQAPNRPKRILPGSRMP